FKEINEVCPVSQVATSCFRQSVHSTASNDLVPEPRRVLQTRPSDREFFSTIGRRPSRPLQLDDYHYMQDPAVMSPRSMDVESLAETFDTIESMVCADAIIHETMGRQGRNPDGTLRVWSLQPLQLSPLRTSFLFNH